MKAARIAKWRETETQEQTSSPKAQNPAHPQTDKVTFVWDGSRLLQEVHPDRTHTYIYTEADSYELLAQITNYTDPDKTQQIHYFHCDQIGIPRAMSDEAGNIVWRGQYDAWGKLLHEEKADGIHQPFRLQNQYYDQETGLHYNFFRYYDPTVGRFTQQDPIGLVGGDNLYRFAPNIQTWIDPLGWSPADVEKIKSTFYSTVKDMTSSGLRLESPFQNNQSRFWGKLTGDVLGDSRKKDCGEQTDYMIEKLKQGKYDDTWIFYMNAGIGHAWGEAQSTNPKDPKIYFDTRSAQFSIGNKCDTCKPWFGSPALDD